MTYVITSRCVGDLNLMCFDICPVQCVSFEDGVDSMCFIDPEGCIDCGACVPACPETAIYPEATVPPEERRFIAINALYFQNRAEARTALAVATRAGPRARPRC
ncbi:MAG: hypothetical protein AMXMBFR23_00620 [Chloroflexota bacterium]